MATAGGIVTPADARAVEPGPGAGGKGQKLPAATLLFSFDSAMAWFTSRRTV
jgi:hypothetical protein